MTARKIPGENVYDAAERLERELRRVKRGSRWLGESRDYWKERARAAEWAYKRCKGGHDDRPNTG